MVYLHRIFGTASETISSGDGSMQQKVYARVASEGVKKKHLSLTMNLGIEADVASGMALHSSLQWPAGQAMRS
ncbi:hypothetical protein IF2G_05914 [Cordyceps javanica]|nr:hypothetical protein IF2G_05914 [Cordyceps javanica]